MSQSLITAVTVQILCQLYKVVYYSLKNRQWEGFRFFSAGGMPSAHSAFVTALSLSIGLDAGFKSNLFALAFVFSIIIIYDSIRLRGAVQTHSQLLDRLQNSLAENQRIKLPLHIGHSLGEIVVGVIVGGALASLAWLLF